MNDAKIAEREMEFAKREQEALERIFGPMHDMVGHALIPFVLGGALDMYYFPSCMPGTVFVTMELLGPNGKGPRKNRLGTYELVTCTRHALPDFTTASREEPTPFNLIERRMCGIMTGTAFYAFEEVLEPGETAEIPAKDDEVHCIVFDEFNTNGVPFEIDGRRHGLLLVVEVHPSELDHARRHGSPSLLAKLKAAGVYPYSDLDRAPVA